MKNLVMCWLAAGLLLSSCGTYTGQGAYAGGMMGSVVGSAIGGLSGGWRGSHTGSLIGMAGGAIVGAAIESAADRQRRDYDDRLRRDYDDRQEKRYDDNSGFDATNSGDDRIDFDGAGPRNAQVGNAPTRSIQVNNQNNGRPIKATKEIRISSQGANASAATGSSAATNASGAQLPLGWSVTE